MNYHQVSRRRCNQNGGLLKRDPFVLTRLSDYHPFSTLLILYHLLPYTLINVLEFIPL